MEYWNLARIEFMNIRRLLVYLVPIAFLSTLFTINCIKFSPDSRSPLTDRVDFHFQEQSNVELANITPRAKAAAPAEAAGGGRKLLSGLGSSPPRCISKCGRCTPCWPVHVPVPPGTPVTAEYYPEAWMCKCGNKLYIP